jgi:mannosyltransferase
VALFTALGALCAFLFIDGKSLSFDEGISVWFAGLRWLDLWNSLHQVDGVQAPYYVVLHIWTTAFGSSPVAVRSLSGVFSVATVPAIYLLARSLVDRKTSLLASLFCSTSVFVVTYAQIARPYALESFSSILSLLAFVYFQKRPTRLGAFGYVAISGVAIYLHPFALLMIAAQLVSLPLLTPNWRKQLPISMIMALTLALLYTPIAVLQLNDGLSQFDWIPRQEDIVSLGRPLVAFAGSIALAIVMILCSSALFFVVRDREQRNHLGVLAIWFGFPIGLGWAISFYHPVFVSRYFASAFPPFVILVASSVRSIRSEIVSGLATILIVALSIGAVWSGRNASSQDIRGAASLVSQNATAHDAVVIFQPAAIFAFQEELEHRGEVLRAPIVYPLVEARSWSQDLRRIDPSLFPLGHYDHIWLVTIDLDRTHYAALMAHLAKKYVEESYQQYSNVAVQRLDARRPASPLPSHLFDGVVPPAE